MISGNSWFPTFKAISDGPIVDTATGVSLTFAKSTTFTITDASSKPNAVAVNDMVPISFSAGTVIVSYPIKRTTKFPVASLSRVNSPDTLVDVPRVLPSR